MPDYQVIARRYRPQKFCDVIAQDSIVTTLKNAIKHERIAHAYLFCGSRGTGKTTLARIFAKALNCLNLSDECEPCGKCSSCKEITQGSSLDVLEIDGASHRGIDDIRQINETVGYTTASGSYKIFIIDEVHMLTKEAFNALLKTLEEPPKNVKFFFATTEPHKILPTILSRCQRFNLNRIPVNKMIEKLKSVSEDLQLNVEEEALRMIANRAEGGLRDAESLLDQIYSFHGTDITTETVATILGIMSRDSLFELDVAGKEGRLTAAFDIAHQVFSQGKDIIHFVETLTEHFRTILHIKLSGPSTTQLSLSEEERLRYHEIAAIYSQEQCMDILDYLIEAQNQIRFSPSVRIALESILLHIIRTHRRVPVDVLVRRLAELEQSVISASQHSPPETSKQSNKPLQEAQQKKIEPEPTSIQSLSKTSSSPCPPPQEQKQQSQPAHPSASSQRENKEVKPQEHVKKQEIKPDPQPQKKTTKPLVKDRYQYDTMMQFAAVELEGKLEKKSIL